MTTKKINEILKHGSVRKKIILFFNDLAINNAGYHVNMCLERLTAEQKEDIKSSIKGKKDKVFYNQLIKGYKSYLIFRNNPIISLLELQERKNNININVIAYLSFNYHKETINELMELVEDKANKELIRKHINKELAKKDPTLKYFVNNKKNIDLKFISQIKENLENKIKEINIETVNQKETLTALNLFLKKHLPLPFLIDNIKQQITATKDILNKIGEIIEEVGIEFSPVIKWDKVEVKITDEDIEDIKNAGL